MATAVFFHAHPDDEAIATGGTMALAAEAGHRVVLVLATQGEQGEPIEGVLADGEQLGDRRAAEVADAAAILGVHRYEFLGYRDSGMMGEPTNDEPDCFWQADLDEAADRLADILREESADVLTVYDSHGGYGHPDHIQVHRVGIEAATRAGVERVFESTMNRTRIMAMVDAMIEADLADADMKERRANMDDEPFGSPESSLTHCIDVAAIAGRKKAAMAAHASQIGPDAFFLTMPDDQFAASFGREWYIARFDGSAADRKAGEFATNLFS
ncbi:MAG: GlcNAc-PI de-N-acetylase [Acidimicrobiales bacterium]|nr:GlcNAc-PI de-N-acetylase [Acidimicrobiales bacterium]